MISEQDVNLILEPVIEGMMAGYDVKVGLTEQRFHQLAGLFTGNEKADCAWFEVIDAINEMWAEIARSAFWVGYSTAKNGNTGV